MLHSAKLIGFLFTTDYDRAREFYEKKLQFHFVSQDQYALVLRVGPNMIRIGRVPNFQPAQGTVLGWEVADVKAAVLWLKERGIETEKYPFVEDRQLGIWNPPGGDQVAWFKDPDGNVLGLSSHAQRR